MLHDDDEFVIAACDGLWDVMSNKQAVEFARKSLKRHGDPKQASQELSNEALRRRSADNVSVLILSFIERPGFCWGGRQNDSGAGQTSAQHGMRGRATSIAYDARGGGGASATRTPLLVPGSASPEGFAAPTLRSLTRPSPDSSLPAARPRPSEAARLALRKAMATAGQPATPRTGFARAWDDESPPAKRK